MSFTGTLDQRKCQVGKRLSEDTEERDCVLAGGFVRVVKGVCVHCDPKTEQCFHPQLAPSWSQEQASL